MDKTECVKLTGMEKQYFGFDKLVRDRLVDEITSQRHEVVGRELGGNTLRLALLDKLDEEFLELKASILEGDESEILTELADVETVMRSLAKALGIEVEKLEEKIAQKVEKKGAFDEGRYVEEVGLNPDGEDYEYWLEYFRKNPDKYPERKDA
jgi:predicted house-cleaning noncanonical NTP pyrophosphatase (MazG superfamily)